MSPEQLEQTKKMAQNMYASGQMPPGMPTPPGGMPGYRPGAGSGVPSQAPKPKDQDLPPELKSDYDMAKE